MENDASKVCKWFVDSILNDCWHGRWFFGGGRLSGVCLGYFGDQRGWIAAADSILRNIAVRRDMWAVSEVNFICARQEKLERPSDLHREQPRRVGPEISLLLELLKAGAAEVLERF